MSCCPNSSLPGHPGDYTKNAGYETEQNGTSYYRVGGQHSDQAIIIFPDIWGWDSGRTREIADMLSEKFECTVAIPKLLVPTLEGGNNGDGLPVDFDTVNRRPVLFEWIKSISWDDSVAPKVREVLSVLKEGGATKIGAIGMCWGGWALCQASKMDASVVVGVVPHPSIHLEAGAHGNDDRELCAAVNCPVHLLPAGNDSADDYDAGGRLFSALPEGSTTTRYDAMSHGWVSRGDISKLDVARDVESALKIITDRLAAHLNVAG